MDSRNSTCPNVFPNTPPVAPTFTEDQASAAEEIGRQLRQAFALVSGAKARVQSSDDADGVTIELLDMAEDLLADLEYINRLAPELGSAGGG